jgi:DNA-3-methyladenine glycosylase I
VTDLMVGDDGLARCDWRYPPEFQDYHDHEWGLPVGDDTRIFEKLCLEGFQAGLSWLTILRKREGFRRAFANFDPAVIAAFRPKKIEQLVRDPQIVRNRKKIEATIANAKAALRLAEQDMSLAALLWSHEPKNNPVRRTFDDLPASTPESKRLSAELRRHGFRFVGPTTVYAAMQALGVVNDHLRGCHHGAVAEAARATFKRPQR